MLLITVGVNVANAANPAWNKEWRKTERKDCKCVKKPGIHMRG